MPKNADLDYFYPNEAEQFSFYRIPKILFTDERYRDLSAEAKILYGLMLDRMCLSVKNGWFDGKGHVFIYFTLEDSLKLLNCGHGKAVRLFAELDAKSGVGLIERKKQGQGRPAKIFVKNFATDIKNSENRKPETPAQPEIPVPESPKANFQEAAEVQDSKKGTSLLPKNGSAECPKPDGSNTYVNDTDLNDTDQSIYPATAAKEVSSHDDSMDAIEAYREIIKENISYDILKQKCDVQRLDEIVDIMLETLCSRKKQIRIAGEDFPAEVVKSRLLKLDDSHIEYVLECLDRNTTDIRNIRSYILTALYQAPTTINSYYAARVSHDLYGDSRS
jgi:hypothetical protein